MAEAAGLAIGTIALVGTFKDCIDVYGMIVASRSLNEEAEVLSTMLDVERMLLLQWADRIGMTEPERYDRRLDDPDLHRTIAKVLASMKKLLSDGSALRERYGLVDSRQVPHEIAFDERLDVTAGSTRLQKFIERFNKLSLHTEVLPRSHSVTTRFKWVVKDKEKFGSLMKVLSYFVSRLNDLIPAQEQSGKAMTEVDLAQIRSIPHLKLIFKASIGSQPEIASVAQQAIRFHNQQRVLDRLWFRWIDDRKMNISERHARTLDWALEPTDTTTKWDNLAEWLRKDSGLYWLAGKPGSGKSTLMKYLSGHPRTTSLIQEWAGQSELVTLEFFLYALGRPEQKSLEGLLRSLLFQFLDNHRELIEQMLPHMWKEALITEDKDHDLGMPSISEMKDALLQLPGMASPERKFWILVDGLDEFQGKHATMAELLSSLEKLPNVKLLVSSRPLPVFVTVFKQSPKMYLQDLTKQDIEAYIDDTILHHPRISQKARAERDMLEEVASILLERASGVILWVVLACRSVLEGLEEYETLPELLTRVRELASDLSDFFRQIITGVHPRKRDQSARLLRLVFEHERCNIAPMPALGLALITEQGLRADIMGPSVTGLDDEQLVQRCEKLEGRLRSLCSSLVELQQNCHIDFAQKLCKGRLTAEGGTLVNSRVSFMHRSLYEFLCTEGVWEWDVLRVDNGCGTFEPHAILALLWTQLVGLGPWRDRVDQLCLSSALYHNAYADAANCQPKLLATNLSRFQGLFVGDVSVKARGRRGLLQKLARLCTPHQPKCQKGYGDLSLGLALAAELGMAGLVQFALEEPNELRRTLVQPDVKLVQACSSFSTCPTALYKLNNDGVESKSKHGTRSTVLPLLYHALCQPCLYMGFKLVFHYASVDRSTSDIVRSNRAVEYLLKEGHDPNEKFYTRDGGLKTTPWIEWLKAIAEGGPLFISNDASHPIDLIWLGDGKTPAVHQIAAYTLLLVDAGAELGAPGTDTFELVGKCLGLYISNVEQRSCRASVEMARSDDLWLKVRDRIQSLRAAESPQHAHS